MAAYIILVAVPILFQIYFRKRRNTKIIITSFFIILIGILAFRSISVGIDLANYIPWFKLLHNTPWENVADAITDVEPGFLFLTKFISVFSGNEQVYLAVVACIVVVPLFILYYRESEDPLLSISIFLILPNFCMLFSGLRQAIAISLGVPVYYLARKKKLFWFLCIVVLAIFLHKSAFMLVLLYPLLHVRITKKWLWFVVPCMVVMLLFNAEIFNFLLQFLGETYQDRYGEIESTGAYAMIILFVLFAVYAFVVPSASKLDADTIGLRNILLLTVCIQFFAPLNNVAMRMNYYFLIFLPILIPKIANRCKESDVKIVSFSKAVMIVFFLVYFFINLATATNSLNIYPYIPFWAE